MLRIQRIETLSSGDGFSPGWQESSGSGLSSHAAHVPMATQLLLLSPLPLGFYAYDLLLGMADNVAPQE